MNPDLMSETQVSLALTLSQALLPVDLLFILNPRLKVPYRGVFWGGEM